MYSTRYERPSKGYQVRLTRAEHSVVKGRRYRFFSDAKHGGQRGAQIAAEALMVELREKLPEPEEPETQRLSMRWRDLGRGELHLTVYVHAPVPTTRSVAKHGLAEAVRQAVELADYTGPEAERVARRLRQIGRAMMREVEDVEG